MTTRAAASVQWVPEAEPHPSLNGYRRVASTGEESSAQVEYVSTPI